MGISLQSVCHCFCQLCFTSYIKQTNQTSLTISKRPTERQMTGGEAMVSHWRSWTMRHGLRPLGSSSAATLPSLPRISLKPDSAEEHSPSMDRLHRDCPSSWRLRPQNTWGLPNIPSGTWPARATGHQWYGWVGRDL